MTQLTSDFDTNDEFLGKLFYWCFRWGCEVQLSNVAKNIPVMRPLDTCAVGESHELAEDGSLVDMDHRTKHKVIEIPELRFKRDDKMISIMGNTWEELKIAVWREHRRIFLELSVPFLNLRIPK